MFTTNTNEKLESANFNYNKSSFISMVIFAALCCFVLGVDSLRNGAILLALFFFGYSFLTMYLIFNMFCITQKAGQSLESFFNCLCGFVSIFFPCLVTITYLYGLELKRTQKIYLHALGILNVLFSTRLFKSKGTSYIFALVFSINVVILTYVYYFLYGYNEFIGYFDSLDLLYASFSIFMIFSITFCKVKYSEYYVKTMCENDFMTEKFNSMFKNIITPIIKIEKEIFNIEFNDNITVFLEKILGNNNEDLKGLLDIGQEAIEHFRKETKITEEYIQFSKILNTKYESNSSVNSNYSKNSINALHLFETSKFKTDIFYKRLYYLNRIFKYFKSEKIKKTSLGSPPKKSPILASNSNTRPNIFNLFFSESNNFDDDDEEKYKKVGNFYVNSISDTSASSKTTTVNNTFDMLYRKSAIFGIEFIDILFYDTTAVSEIEKEKANTEVESRKQYLSIVSDKFMTPIQVLLLRINSIAKIFKDQNKQLPKEFDEIQNLGTYIQIMNQDITCCSRIDNGLDVNFETFKTDELFNLSKEVIDILIRNNATKCYAIKTKLIISNEVPKILNSDINRLRQVLINLLTNAYKFTLSGIIKIVVSFKESNLLFDEIGVSIKDNGIGISDEYRDILNSQIKEITDLKSLNYCCCHGLGLIMSNIIVSRLGRNIEYEHNKPGSNFSFSFFNIKSKEIEDSIKSDKFRKIKDIIDETTKEYSIKNVSTKIEHNSELEKILLKEKRNKLSVSSKNICKKSSQLIATSLEDNYKYNNNLINGHVSNLSLNCETFKLKNNEIKEIPERNENIKDKYNDDNVKFDVDHVNNLNDEYENDYNKTSRSRIRRSNSSPRLPTEKNPSGDRIFPFEDNVFDFYKINKSDSIFFATKSLDVESLIILKNISIDQNINKFSALFNEISSIFRLHYENVDFLKVYENFKPYLKFFHSSLKEAINIKFLETQGSSGRVIDENRVKRILLVDDNKPILKALKNVTTLAIKDLNLTNKIEILKAYDGVDALALFKIDHYTSQSIKYIISDHNMSMMDGCKFIKLVNNYKLGRDIKLYISSTDNEIIKSNNIKNVEFINKPVSKSNIKNLLLNLAA